MDPIRHLDSSCSSYSVAESASCSAPWRLDGADNALILMFVTLFIGRTGFPLVIKLGGADCKERVWMCGSGNDVGEVS